MGYRPSLYIYIVMVKPLNMTLILTLGISISIDKQQLAKIIFNLDRAGSVVFIDDENSYISYISYTSQHDLV